MDIELGTRDVARTVNSSPEQSADEVGQVIPAAVADGRDRRLVRRFRFDLSGFGLFRFVTHISILPDWS